MSELMEHVVTPPPWKLQRAHVSRRAHAHRRGPSGQQAARQPTNHRPSPTRLRRCPPPASTARARGRLPGFQCGSAAIDLARIARASGKPWHATLEDGAWHSGAGQCARATRSWRSNVGGREDKNRTRRAPREDGARAPTGEGPKIDHAVAHPEAPAPRRAILKAGAQAPLGSLGLTHTLEQNLTPSDFIACAAITAAS